MEIQNVIAEHNEDVDKKLLSVVFPNIKIILRLLQVITLKKIKSIKFVINVIFNK